MQMRNVNLVRKKNREKQSEITKQKTVIYNVLNLYYIKKFLNKTSVRH